MPRAFTTRFPQVPIVLMSSWYDAYVRTTFDNYAGSQGERDGRCRLIMGPWLHGDRSRRSPAMSISVRGADRRQPDHVLGGFPPALVRPLAEGRRQRRRGRAGGTPVPDGRRLRPQDARAAGWTMAGAGSRRRDWPLPAGASDAVLPARRRSAQRGAPPARRAAAHLRFRSRRSGADDRRRAHQRRAGVRGRRLRPARGGALLRLPPHRPAALGAAGRARPSRPRRCPRTSPSSGPISVTLHVASDAPDTDFTAKLIDVYPPSADYPGGYALILSDGIIRCRYRTSFERPEPIVPGEVFEVTIEPFPPPISSPAATASGSTSPRRTSRSSTSIRTRAIRKGPGAPARSPATPSIAMRAAHRMWCCRWCRPAA